MTAQAQPDSRFIVVTGANGQLGRALLTRLAARGETRVRALVRSDRARRTIESLDLDPAPEIHVVSYTDPGQMETALADAEAVIHLVGIIKETPDTRYVEAHEQTCEALAIAAERAGVSRIVYLSILGSRAASQNACLASKGRAEQRLLEGTVATTVLRVPMVIGGDDAASASLRRQAQAKQLRLVGGGQSLQQPIDARDVVTAILAALRSHPGRPLVLDAGGPVCLTHRDLVLKAADLYGNTPRLSSIPLGLARMGVRVVERVLPNPPISIAMFDILQHNDRVDPTALCEALGITLTPLEQTLADHVGPDRDAVASATPRGRDQGDPR